MIQDIKDITSFKWATVRGVDPLYIQLDGDSAPLALIPDTLIDPAFLVIGSRVRVELSLRKVVVHGLAGGSELVLPHSHTYASLSGKPFTSLYFTTFSTPALGAGSSTTLTLTFPTGRFASTPVFVALSGEARVTIGTNTRSASSVTLVLFNSTGASAAAATGQFIAVL